jgi:hypothetical protein
LGWQVSPFVMHAVQFAGVFGSAQSAELPPDELEEPELELDEPELEPEELELE